MSGLKTQLQYAVSERADIVEAIAGMLPKNRLSKRLITKLKVYRGNEHPHGAQQAVAVAAKD